MNCVYEFEIFLEWFDLKVANSTLFITNSFSVWQVELGRESRDVEGGYVGVFEAKKASTKETRIYE